MVICWIRYRSGQGFKYLLGLKLGEFEGKLCLLDSKRVTAADAKAIRSVMGDLAKLSLEDRVAWVRRVCPASFRLAYRTIGVDKLQVLREY